MKTYEKFNSKVGYYVQLNLPKEHFNNSKCDSFLKFLNNTVGKIINVYDDGVNIDIEYPIKFVQHNTCVKYYMYFSPNIYNYYFTSQIKYIENISIDKNEIDRKIEIKQRQEKFNL
jgi:hypothetical protein